MVQLSGMQCVSEDDVMDVIDHGDWRTLSSSYSRTKVQDPRAATRESGECDGEAGGASHTQDEAQALYPSKCMVPNYSSLLCPSLYLQQSDFCFVVDPQFNNIHCRCICTTAHWTTKRDLKLRAIFFMRFK